MKDLITNSKHTPMSLADTVYLKLENDIINGKYKRGQILSESALCKDLGISRTPVMEALKELCHDKLIEKKSKGYEVIGVYKEDVHDIMLIRRHLECEVARRCTLNITDEQLENLKESVELEEFYFSKNNIEAAKEMDNLFHTLIYKYSGSSVYYALFTELHKKLQKYRKASLENHTFGEQSIKEHQDIYNAIKEKDSNNAMELMKKHINNTNERLLQVEKEVEE